MKSEESFQIDCAKILKHAQKHFDFAKGAHQSIGQKRKCGKLDYFDHHVKDVSKTVVNLFGRHYSILTLLQMYKVALFHDYLEDVACYKSIDQKFSHKKARKLLSQSEFDAVVELTNVYTSKAYPFLTKSERKGLEAKRLNGISNLAILVKIADIKCNGKDNPSKDWIESKIKILQGFVNRFDSKSRKSLKIKLECKKIIKDLSLKFLEKT